jgi:hypothetical protein
MSCAVALDLHHPEIMRAIPTRIPNTGYVFGGNEEGTRSPLSVCSTFFPLPLGSGQDSPGQQHIGRRCHNCDLQAGRGLTSD